MALAAVMAVQMFRRWRTLRLPAGFGVWLLFLVWVMLGALVLFADAPGAVPGGGSSRILVFAYRLAWYSTATVFLLWVTNQPRRAVADLKIYRLLGWMFVVTAIGGLAGVFFPTFEYPSPVELALPGGLRGNSLIQAIAHPALADIQNALGYPQARPKAPFAYANSWGSNFALFVIFFATSWLGRGAGWRRPVGVVVLVLAAIPVVYSLNRGLWACLALGVVGIGLLLIRRGRVAGILAMVALLAAATLAFFLSPLGNIYEDRLDHQHSNDRRSQLLQETVKSTVEGSPVVGFGSTRDVQGSFASIAGASTPDCPACGVPPLGTQGHLWMVIFSQGLVGTAWFLAFIGVSLSRCWRCRTTAETIATFALVFFTVQLLVYDTLGLPLVTVMIAIGLVAREQAETPLGRTRPVPRLGRLVARIRRLVPVVCVLMLIGALAGFGYAVTRPIAYSAEASVSLAPYPTALDPESVTDDSVKQRETTPDTEAAIIMSEQVLSSVLDQRHFTRTEELRRSLRVTAYPNTRILRVQLRGRDKVEVEQVVAEVAQAYLDRRRTYLVQRQQQILTQLRERRARLGPLAALTTTLTTGPGDPLVAQQTEVTTKSAETRIDNAIVRILLTAVEPGEIVRLADPVRIKRAIGIPVATGMALGLMVGALLICLGREPLGQRGRRPRSVDS